MDKNLLKKYLEYAASEEAIAVLFVKKHLKKAKDHWIDISNSRKIKYSYQCKISDGDLHFKFVTGRLYKRKLKPQYPPKSEFMENGRFREHDYYLAIRAITWETAHKDIEQQKKKSVKAINFNITGVSYDKNRDNKNYFRSDAPSEIKALAKNLSDRTDPLWDKAIEYAVEPEFVYEIKSIKLS
ncbi:hypothetical protein [Vibrio porteresiae]|uniref:Phage protein n=1 Tax=Vibrio porteresiae DSM 19223 TaxID=1123496 RepID=A0ABZ0QKE4_9VIBR|nr:hypothetical protein [Vibrio porteresiae]WPC75935.1 hypothetical protein R8Z52_23770 [Vibrio porteresiae DSM 19223]